MRAHRTRMLAAVLGTAVLVTGIAPAAVLAAKPADHGNPHATAPAPDPSVDPSVEPSPDPVEATPAPVVEPTAEPTEAPVVTPDPTEAPVNPSSQTIDPDAAPVGTSAQPEVAPEVVDLSTTLTLGVTPATFSAGDSITITATVEPDPVLRHDRDPSTTEPTTSGLADVAGAASVTTTAAAGLTSVDASYSGCARLPGQHRPRRLPTRA